MTQSSTSVGIIGCGLIGAKRAHAVAPGTVQVVADLDLSRATALASSVGAQALATWQDVIKSDVGLVVVATPHHLLSSIAMEALRAGKHILVEKPGGTRAADLHALADVAEQDGLIAKIGFNHRFHPALAKAKALLDSGKFGPIMFIRGVYGHGGRIGYENEWRMRKAISGGGQLIDQAAHLIDLSRWYMGDFRACNGINRRMFWPVEVEDNTFVSLVSEAGGVAWLHAGWTEWKNRFHFEIMARDAKLEITGLGGSYGVERLTLYKMLPQMGPPETTSWEYPFPDGSWRSEMANTIDAIEGRAAAIGDARDAARMLEIIESIYERADATDVSSVDPARA